MLNKKSWFKLLFPIVMLVAVIPTLLAIGCTGAQGIQGPQGDSGISINWLGSLAAIPDSPQLNDGYYNTATGKSFIWDGDSWEILAQDGVQGDQGIQGATRITGGTGITGTTGCTWVKLQSATGSTTALV